MINRNKKIVYLIGGSGLIGSQILKQLSKKYKILNLDIKKKGNNFEYFNCTDITKINTKLTGYFKKYGTPHILINCSYPTKGEWIKNDFQNLRSNRIKINLEGHL